MPQLILDSYPYRTERHLHGFFEGVETLTHRQGAYGFHKGIVFPGPFPSYRTHGHTESPPSLYETFTPSPVPRRRFTPSLQIEPLEVELLTSMTFALKQTEKDVDVKMFYGVGCALRRLYLEHDQINNLYTFSRTCQ